MGINDIPSPKLFFYQFNPDDKLGFVLLVWFFVLVTFFILRRIVLSRFGRALEAVREDEIAASAMGIDVTKYKIIAFCIGAFFAGIAGSLWATYNQSVAPQTFDFMLSILILCMVVLGGMGNNLAVLFGAVLIVITSELPRLLGFSSKIPPQTNQILFGLILVVMMIYRPQGIIGRKKMNFEALIKKTISRREESQ
jgi:branched-chain amino acid transport system permease protein